MTCEEVRAELVECWGSTEQLTTAATEHLAVCEHCRYEARILRGTSVMLHSLPSESAPEGFTAGVLQQIARQQGQTGWAARLGQWFVPAHQPSWTRAAAVGTAIALAVAGGSMWAGRGSLPEGTQQYAGSASGTIAVSTPAATEAELDDLMRRHQALQMTQPLADDPCVNLVVYTTK